MVLAWLVAAYISVLLGVCWAYDGARGRHRAGLEACEDVDMECIRERVCGRDLVLSWNRQYESQTTESSGSFRIDTEIPALSNSANSSVL